MNASRMTAAYDTAGCFLGRNTEINRLREAIRKRESLLIWGASDAGKTALVSKLISELPEKIARHCLCAAGHGSPQEILRGLIKKFEDTDNPLLGKKFRAEAGYGESFAHWTKQQTSLRLRGLLYKAVSEGEYWIFFEDVAPITHILARIIKELIWNRKTPVYLVARGWTYTEVGHVAQLYWTDQHRLQVGPLAFPAAKELLETCIRQFALSQFDLEGFREDILEFSGLLPGAIIKMCEAAADSRYHFEGRIKTKLLHVDYLVSHCQDTLRPRSEFRSF